MKTSENISDVEQQFDYLVRQVQKNCDIADAKFGGNDSLCIYLLKMRDQYIWRNDIELGADLDRKALGKWINQTENYWDEIEDLELQPLEIHQKQVDCFDNRVVNELINSSGLVYSAGLGQGGRPVFFLGKLLSTENSGPLQIYVSGDEYARSLSSPPGMSRGNDIYIRKDALTRYLHSIVEEWQMRKSETRVSQVMKHYRFELSPENALSAMVEDKMENVILHELGERVAEDIIGEGWREMLQSIKHPVHELKVRAIRDNLADCATTLPGLICDENAIGLELFYSGLSPLRRELFPSLCEVIQKMESTAGSMDLKKIVTKGQVHWTKICKNLLAQYKDLKSDQLDKFLQECVL